jgi:mannosyltransferase PIG-V
MRALPRPWPFVLAAWAASRAFFFLVGALGHAYVTSAQPGGFPREPGGILNYWAHWDGGWYTTIATQGYFNPPSTSFFPLYPILIWLGKQIAGGAAFWGVAISTLALLPALFFCYRIAEDLFDERVARATVLVLAFFPSAFFLNAVYTESLFLMLTAGSIWALRCRRNLLVAGAFAYFATATRNVGVVLLVPLVYEWLRHRRELGYGAVVGLAVAPGGLAAYMTYLAKGLGHPLYFAIAQRETWGRALTNPLKTLHKAWTTGVFGARYAFHPHAIFGNASPEPAFKASDTFNLILLGLLVALLVVGLTRLPIDLWTYSFLVMLAPFLTPSPFWALTSFNRYLLAPFPLFIVLGWLLTRVRWVLVPWLAASAAAGVYLTVLFTTWRWVA